MAPASRNFETSLTARKERKSPTTQKYQGRMRSLIDPEVLVESLGVEQQLIQGKYSFANTNGAEYWSMVRPLIFRAAAIYQALPATKYAHHTGYAGMLTHSIEVADDLVSMMRNSLAHDRAKLPPLFANEDRKKLTALIFGFGLFHDLCSLHSSLHIFAVSDKRSMARTTFDPRANSGETTLYDFVSERQMTFSGYDWKFLPHRRLAPCIHCMRDTLFSVLIAMKAFPSEELWNAIFESESPEYHLLMDKLQRANCQSIEKYRQDNETCEYGAVEDQIDDALRYCARFTRLLDNSPVCWGALFLSEKVVRAVPYYLPHYDDFIDARNELRYDNDPLYAKASNALENIEGEPDPVYQGQKGYFLKRRSQLNRDLICFLRQKNC